MTAAAAGSSQGLVCQFASGVNVLCQARRTLSLLCCVGYSRTGVESQLRTAWGFHVSRRDEVQPWFFAVRGGEL